MCESAFNNTEDEKGSVKGGKPEPEKRAIGFYLGDYLSRIFFFGFDAIRLVDNSDDAMQTTDLLGFLVSLVVLLRGVVVLFDKLATNTRFPRIPGG